MLLLVRLGQSDTLFSQMLGHGRVPSQFLTDGVTGNGPSELVSPADLCCVVGGILDVFVQDVEFVVVCTNCLGE